MSQSLGVRASALGDFCWGLRLTKALRGFKEAVLVGGGGGAGLGTVVREILGRRRLEGEGGGGSGGLREREMR